MEFKVLEVRGNTKQQATENAMKEFISETEFDKIHSHCVETRYDDNGFIGEDYVALLSVFYW